MFMRSLDVATLHFGSTVDRTTALLQYCVLLYFYRAVQQHSFAIVMLSVCLSVRLSVTLICRGHMG